MAWVRHPDLTSSICGGFPERYARTMTDDSLSPIDAPCCDIVKGAKYKVFNDCYQDLWAKFQFTEVEIVMKNDGGFCSTTNLVNFIFDDWFVWKILKSNHLIQSQAIDESVCVKMRFLVRHRGNKSVHRLIWFCSFWECLHLKAKRVCAPPFKLNFVQAALWKQQLTSNLLRPMVICVRCKWVRVASE